VHCVLKRGFPSKFDGKQHEEAEGQQLKELQRRTAQMYIVVLVALSSFFTSSLPSLKLPQEDFQKYQYVLATSVVQEVYRH
jgi:hypothetical protein